MKADEKRDDGSIGNIHWNRQGKKKPLYTRVGGDKKRSERRTCTRCGNERHNSRDCPANGQVCSYCKGHGHYSKVCFLKNTVKAVKPSSEIDTSTDTDEEDGYGILMIEALNKLGKGASLMRIKTNGYETLWQPGTGATRNIWDEKQLLVFEKKCGKQLVLTNTNIKLFPYGSDKCLCYREVPGCHRSW